MSIEVRPTEFWRDDRMERIIADIIEISQTEGVELMRVSGLSKRHGIEVQGIDHICHRLSEAGILGVKARIACPHCGEISYLIVVDQTKPLVKMCDTCTSIYQPADGINLQWYVKTNEQPNILGR